MKKFLAFSFATTIVAAMMCACESNKKQGAGNGKDSLTFDSVVVDTTAHLTDKKDSPSCDIKIALTYAKGLNANTINQTLLKSEVLIPDFIGGMETSTDNMVAVVDSFVTRFIADYKKTNMPLYDADHDSGLHNAEYIVKSKVEEGREGILIHTSDVYQYAGGAHGSSQTIVNNIDVKKGRVLTLKDLLVPGGETKIKDMIVQKMMKAEHVDNFKALQDKGFFMVMEAYVPDNFVLGKKEITFIYNADEIAPHVIGQVTVSFPYSDLEKLMK